MANTFKLVTDTAVGTSAATVYTCPASTATTVIGLSLANIISTSITADIQVENNDGDNIYIVKDAPIPIGGALVAIGGDQKLVLNESDVLKVTASDASSIDVALSILEIT
jgi:hypothetical protein